MKNLFLVTLKNPPVTHLIDSYSTQLKDVEHILFNQEGLLLIIPVDINCNIAYIKEITSDDAENILKRIKERTSESKIVKPDYLVPRKKGRDA